MLRFAVAISACSSLCILAAPVVERQGRSTSLQKLALQKVLQDASPIFGYYQKNQSSTSNWMKGYPDDTFLVHMNIPGTHDTATWNYSLATQEALNHVTNLNGLPIFLPEIFRCQDMPIISMLNAGIRVFDLRFAFDATNSTIVFYHSQALQSETATVDDVLYGYYRWLDDHPSEAVFLSFNYEGSTAVHARNDAAVQLMIFNTLTSAAAKKYFVQTRGELGTLGEARGRITLLRRFPLDQLPESYSEALPGVYFPASQWTDNDSDIALVYNTEKNLTAYIEDHYEFGLPAGTPATVAIQMKYNATTAHLIKAATQYPDSLFWSFASSEGDYNTPVETPQIMAIGNGTEYTPLGGVNQQLASFLKQMKEKRLGIIMFDFFETPGDLIQTILDL